MGAYALSIFIHGIALAVIFLSTSKAPHLAAPPENLPLYVEMISLPARPPQLSVKARSQKILKKPWKKKKTTKLLVTSKKEFSVSDNSSNVRVKRQRNIVQAQSATTTSPNPRHPSTTLSYAEELKVYLEKNKHYPRQALRLKQSGTVLVKVKIRTGGAFSDPRIARPCQSPILNQAALDLFVRLKSFKPLPKDVQNNSVFTIPIAYVMGG